VFDWQIQESSNPLNCRLANFCCCACGPHSLPNYVTIGEPPTHLRCVAPGEGGGHRSALPQPELAELLAVCTHRRHRAVTARQYSLSWTPRRLVKFSEKLSHTGALWQVACWMGAQVGNFIIEFGELLDSISQNRSILLLSG
jgi:hypothetical protein